MRLYFFPGEVVMEEMESGSGISSSAGGAGKTSLTIALLLEAIEFKALPRVQDDPGQCMVIPRANFKEMKAEAPLLPGVEILLRSIRSRKVPVQGRPTGVQITSARWPEDGLETKRFPLIGCTIRGTADLRISNYTLRCPEGNFILISGSIPHADGSRPHIEDDPECERGCDILWFSPIGDVLKCWICRSENGKHSGMPTVYLKRKDLCGYCDALFEGFGERSPVRARIRQGLLIALMSSVQNEILEGRYFRWLPQTGTEIEDEETDPIKRAQKHIREHISEPLHLDGVARHCFMSRSHFAKIFREQTGETFNEYVTRCRLEEAKLRLTTTTAQIAGIARHVGLKPRHFNDLIRQHTGMSPSDYRRQNRDEANSW